MALARDVCLSQKPAGGAGVAHCTRVDPFLLDRYELVGDGVEVELRDLEPTGEDRGLCEPSERGDVGADVRPCSQRAEVRAEVESAWR